MELDRDTPVLASLFPWQQRALDFLARQRVAAIVAGVGTGKSRIAIEWAKATNSKLLVICPKTAISVWKEQLALWGSGVPHFLINYEQTWRDLGSARIREFLRPSLGKTTLMVLDESHKIKDRRSKQSKATRKLGERAEHRLIMTATPVANGVWDLWAQYNFLLGDWPDADLWKKWQLFAENHLIFNPYFPNKVEAVRDMPTIRSQLAPFTFHINAEEVLQLPPGMDLFRECELGGEAKSFYTALDRELYAEFGDEFAVTTPLAITKLLRLSEVAGGFVHPDGQAQSNDSYSSSRAAKQISPHKLNLLREVLEEIGSEESVVIFTRFTAERQAIQRLLTDLRIRWVALHGGQTSEERDAELVAFRSKKASVLVATLQVGSSSIDLTVARYLIFYSVAFSFTDYFQARGRTRRIGQTRPQVNIHLITKDTIDEDVMSAIKHKGTVSDAVRAWWRRHD